MPRSPRRRSQPWPASWNVYRSCSIAGGVGSGLKRASPSSMPGQPLIQRHLAELEPVLVDREARRRADEVDHVAAGSPLLEEAQRTLDVVAPEHLPAAVGVDERSALRREPPQLVLVEAELADAELPVEMREEPGRRTRVQVRADPRRA